MARDIKFRAWRTPFPGSKFGQKYLYGSNVFSFYNMKPDQYKLEQFTGLTDVNGTEIYEGDIVRMHVIILSPDDKIGVVKYSPQYGYSIYFTSGRMARQEYWATGDKHTIEVIGNIHENPELLEEK